MSDMDGGDFGGARSEVGGWLRSEAEENDLRRYLTTLRERRGLILLCVLVATLVAVAYVVLAKPVYEAQANVVVLPVNLNGNDALTGLPLVVASADPTVDVQTAAELVRTTGAAAATKVALHLGDTPQQILGRVSVIPVAGSSVVAVTGSGSTAGAAAQLANTFAGSAIAQRTAVFYRQLDQQIAGLKRQVAVSSPAVATQLSVQVTELETLRAGPLPDMRIATLAAPPGAPASPRKKLSIAAGLVGGLVIGVIAAFVLQAVDPRLRREEQLRRLFRLPILARIPREGPAQGGPRRPASLSPVSLEAYRTLRATLLASRPGGPPGSILVTGASPSEGKTTTAINLAFSLAWSGASVILIEADIRQPSVGRALGLESEFGLTRLLRGEVTLEEAMVEAGEAGANLRVLLARGSGDPDALGGDELLLPAASRLLSSAQRLADYVVIDSPPLAEVVDALELARRAEAVLLVARLGQTQMTRLRRLGALLARTGVDPVGIVLVGTAHPRASDNYGYFGAGTAGYPVGASAARAGRSRGTVHTTTR